MHKFFKKHADSTLIIEYHKDTFDPTDYIVISKTNDTVNCFIYNPSEKANSYKFDKTILPKKIYASLGLERIKFQYIQADINVFFLL